MGEKGFLNKFSKPEKKKCDKKKNEKKVERERIELLSMDLSKIKVLVPSIAIEYWPWIGIIYKSGVRELFVCSLDKEFFVDFTRKIQSTCPDIKITYFDLENNKITLPKFGFALPYINGEPVDERLKEYIEEKQIYILEQEKLEKEAKKK